MSKIKSYYLTEKEIVVKYTDKTEARYELNKTNIRNIIASLDKQIDFSAPTFDRELDDVNSKLLAYAASEFIVVMLIFLSFINGFMIMFSASILTLLYLTYKIVKDIIPDYKKLYKLYNATKVNEGREILTKEYNSLSVNSKNAEQLIHVC